jgi:hypothetical protein
LSKLRKFFSASTTRTRCCCRCPRRRHWRGSNRCARQCAPGPTRSKPPRGPTGQSRSELVEIGRDAGARRVPRADRSRIISEARDQLHASPLCGGEVPPDPLQHGLSKRLVSISSEIVVHAGHADSALTHIQEAIEIGRVRRAARRVMAVRDEEAAPGWRSPRRLACRSPPPRRCSQPTRQPISGQDVQCDPYASYLLLGV